MQMADKERREMILAFASSRSKPFPSGIWSLVCCVSLLLLGGATAVAGDTNEFLARIYTNAANKTLPYRLLVPKGYDARQTYPAIL